MNVGRIEQVDPPQQFYEFSDQQFVVEFILSSSMNIIPVSNNNRAGILTAEWSDQAVHL